jgi:hypothetical protein
MKMSFESLLIFTVFQNKSLQFFENELKKPQNLSKRSILMEKAPFIWQ